MTAEMIAALYVETQGGYFDLPNVDPWDEARDARTYPGPHPMSRTRRASAGAGSGMAARASRTSSFSAMTADASCML